MDDLPPTSPADAPERSSARPGPAHLAVGESSDEEAVLPPTGRRRWVVAAVLTPLVLFLLAIVAWAVDTASGGVPRNVDVAGVEVSNLSESALRSGQPPVIARVHEGALVLDPRTVDPSEEEELLRSVAEAAGHA